MGFLNPGALYLFALVPALAIAYLVRERPRRVTVSSVLAFRALSARRGERFGGWPRPDWMFFAELLMLSLAVLALAGPYIIRAGNPIAVVIDDSAPMQAKTSSGATRFAAAIDGARAALSKLGGGEVTIYLTAPTPHRAGPPLKSPSEAASALNALGPSDAPGDQAATAAMLSELASDSRLARVIYAGARAIADPVPARIEQIAVGEPVANYAIGSFVLRRAALASAAMRARVGIANFSPAPQKLTMTVEGDGKPIAHAQAELGAGETATLEFQDLAPASVYRAELEPDDAFALDNVAYASSAAVKSLSILFVSPTPADAAGLGTLPGVTVRAVAPDGFAPDDLASADLAIFEYSVPKEMPPVNAMLVMPPPGDPIFGFNVTPAARVEITGWPPTGPLTDSVNFLLLNPRSGEYLSEHPWMQPIVAGSSGSLMLAGERGGHRFVALGFNPFPYLGKRNLPMSVLTLNCLSYLAGLGGDASGFRTGEPWIVPSGTRTIITPDGRSVPVTPGTLFTDVSEQGLYRLVTRQGVSATRAINLANLAASDLENETALKVEAAGGAAVSSVAPRREPIAAVLLAAIIGLALIEAAVAYRRRRRIAVSV